MTNKERFVKAVKRFQEYMKHKEEKNDLLEKAFGSDTRVFDFDGVEELSSTIIDMSVLMFHNLLEKVVIDNIDWYLFETPNMTEPAVFDGNKKYIIDSPEKMFDMLNEFNEAERI